MGSIPTSSTKISDSWKDNPFMSIMVKKGSVWCIHSRLGKTVGFGNIVRKQYTGIMHPSLHNVLLIFREKQSGVKDGERQFFNGEFENLPIFCDVNLGLHFFS